MVWKMFLNCPHENMQSLLPLLSSSAFLTAICVVWSILKHKELKWTAKKSVDKYFHSTVQWVVNRNQAKWMPSSFFFTVNNLARQHYPYKMVSSWCAFQKCHSSLFLHLLESSCLTSSWKTERGKFKWSLQLTCKPTVDLHRKIN